jgi:hypothetical protein
MGRSRFFSGAIALLALAALLGSTGAATATSSKPVIDISTPTAVDSYLVSKGIDPASVVKQVGLNNYAGPNCPGAGWNCTTATRVAQIAAPGGQNVDECLPSTIVPGDCVILQESDRNTAKCIERSGIAQHCMITQTGARNFARVDQLITESGGNPQDATQTAHVSQSQATQMNELQVDEGINQNTNDDTTHTQDAHQFVVLYQDVTGNGNNFAHVHQTQDQKLGGAATPQNQNTGPLPTLTGDAATTESECATASSTASNGSVSTPNSCAEFNQSSENGDNDGHLHQLTHEDATSTAATAVQNQGGFSTASTNGLGGSFEQFVAPGASGSSHDETVQHKQQHASSNGGTIFQSDPMGCCGISETGGVNNLDDVNQFTDQSASGGNYIQDADIVGTTHVQPISDLSAPATPSSGFSGKCSVSHHAHENDAATNVNESEPAPCLLVVTTHCSSTNAIGAATTTGTGACTTCPPSCGTNLSASVQFLNALPTYGQLLPVMDFGEPSSYALPSWYVPF